MSLDLIQELVPRFVWSLGRFEKLMKSGVSESLGKESTVSIAIDLELVMIDGPQATGQGVIIDENSGERRLQEIQVQGVVEEV